MIKKFAISCAFRGVGSIIKISWTA